MPATQPSKLAEVEAWGALCARGFAHRPGDPRRFIVKYRADPTAKRDNIRVVVEGGAAGGVTPLLGSVRVFERSFNVCGATVGAAGLGEVCTDPDARGKGVANVLLADALQHSEGVPGAAFGVLHAAPTVAGLYARFGFVGGLRIAYARVRTDAARAPAGGALAATTTDGARLCVRAADLAADWPAMAALHPAFMAAMGATAFVRREPAGGYWARWIAAIAGSQYVALVADDDGGGVVGYAAVLQKPEGAKLADFAVDVARVAPAAARAFLAAVVGAAAELVAAGVPQVAAAATMAAGAAVGTPGSSVGPSAPAAPSVSERPEAPGADAPGVPALLVPAIVLRWLGIELDGGAAPGPAGESLRVDASADAESLVDGGWMVRPLPAGVATDACGALRAASDAGGLLVWLVDAF